MRILRRFSRRLVPLLIAVGAIVGLVLEVGAAGASPATKPPIQPQSPANGASVEASGEPLAVTFTCPGYVLEEGEEVEEEVENEEGEEETITRTEPPVAGGPENYGVHFSKSASVSAAGQLGTEGFGEAGEGEAEPIKPANTSCASELELPSKPNPATLYEGRIYWQAFRESAVVPDEVEVGPVESFVVHPHVEEPYLTFREQIFAGYLTKIGFFNSSELEGAVIDLQEWSGTAWTTIGEAPGNNGGENTFYVKFKKPGKHLLRPVVSGGGLATPLGLEPTSRVVRKPGKQRVTGTADDGAYVAAGMKEREESPITFSVANNGGILKNLKLEAETVCHGATKAQNVTIEVPAVIKHARIAPDGTVFGVSKTEGPEVWTVTLVGTLFEGRFQGELSTSRTNCTGFRTINAIRKSSVKE